MAEIDYMADESEITEREKLVFKFGEAVPLINELHWTKNSSNITKQRIDYPK